MSRHQRTQCVNTTKSGTLCSQGTAPCQKHGTLNPVFFMCWFYCLVRRFSGSARRPPFIDLFCMIHLATSLQGSSPYLVGNVVGTPSLLTHRSPSTSSCSYRQAASRYRDNKLAGLPFLLPLILLIYT